MKKKEMVMRYLSAAAALEREGRERCLPAEEVFRRDATATELRKFADELCRRLSPSVLRAVGK